MIPRLLLAGLVEFQHPRQRELADLLTVDGRLAEVHAALERLLREVRQVTPKGGDSYDAILVRSLYCFAVLTYVRCFNSGKRAHLQISSVEGLTPRQLEFHEHIRSMRNQHLAHAVMDEEGAHIYLVRSKASNAFVGFHVLNAILASDGPRDVARFIALVNTVRRHLARRASKVGNEVAKSYFGPKARWDKLSSWAPREVDA